MFSIGQSATLACLLEVSAPKPGNVHRGADFVDLTFYDFAATSVAIAPAFDRAAAGARLGRTVHDAISAMRAASESNVYLGAILLIAPLAMVPNDQPLAPGVAAVLAALDGEDARLVYDAIRLAQPGGMGRVSESDVAGPPPADLMAAMRLAAERDLVALQYADGFHEVLQVVVPWLTGGIAQGWSLIDSIVHTHVRLMAQFPDSLIARKCGPAIALESANRAAAALDRGLPGDEAYERALADLDFWLRADGHRRNPGTTADLIAAGLFAALRDSIITPPFRFAALSARAPTFIVQSRSEPGFFSALE